MFPDRDVSQHIAWIEAAEMEPQLDPAFGLYARVIVNDRPREAVEMAGRLSDEELRNMITTVVARAWLSRDREAAEAWLEQAEIPDEVRKRAYMLGGDPNRDRAGFRAPKEAR